ncbi:MAG TPA: dUTP diphosphatase [Bacteroidia bacterium]
MKVKINNTGKFPLPAYQTELSAGADLYANIENAIEIDSLERVLIPTGLFIELPANTEAQIRPRSGMAFKHGITVLNSPGTIDADYRGEIKVLLVNLSKDKYTIQPGERIAQMVVAECIQAEWLPESNLSETSRGEGGYGHTGKN